MSKKTITKAEFNELSKVLDPLEIIQNYEIEVDSKKHFCQSCGKEILNGHCSNCLKKQKFKTFFVKANKFFLKLFKYFFDYSGRISRVDYFFKNFIIYLFWFLIFILFLIITIIFQYIFNYKGSSSIIFDIFTPIWYTSLFIMVIINKIKRLHDLNSSGWWIILFAVPFVDLVLFSKGIPGKNKFGEDPLELKYKAYLKNLNYEITKKS